jgi:hypothetical protein
VDVDFSVTLLMRWPDHPYHNATIMDCIVVEAVSLTVFPIQLSWWEVAGHCVDVSLSQVLMGLQVTTVLRLSEVSVILICVSGILGA